MGEGKITDFLWSRLIDNKSVWCLIDGVTPEMLLDFVEREKQNTLDKVKDLFPTNTTYTKESKNLANKILRGIDKL